MSKKKIMALVAAIAGFVFFGCGADQGYGENDIGLRKSTLFSENVNIERIDYTGKAAGESTLIERSFENAPPMISHTTDGMLPITKDSNSCTSCHLPDVAAAVMATPMPKSHFYDFRKKAAIKNGGMDETRFNCVICHATQANAKPLVGNNFTPNFRQEQGREKSNLIDVVNEGVN